MHQIRLIEEEIDAIAAEFPTTEFNDSALILQRLAAQLGIQLYYLPPDPRPAANARLAIVSQQAAEDWAAIAPPLNQYLDEQLAEPSAAIAAPPSSLQRYLADNASTIDAIRDTVRDRGRPVLRRHLNPILTGDVTQPVPHYLEMAKLQRLLILAILNHQRQGNSQAALELLEVSWQINQPLRRSPYLVGQLTALISERYILGTLRKFDALPFDWLQRLERHDYRASTLTALELEALVLPFNQRRNPNPKGTDASALQDAVQFYQARRQWFDRWKAKPQNPCQPDATKRHQKALPPKQDELLALATQTQKADKALLDREFTQKILLLKALAATLGQWPEPEALPGLDSAICPGFRWVYRIDREGTMSLSLKPEPRWATKRLQQNQGLPLIYRADRIPAPLSVTVTPPKTKLWRETEVRLQESEIDYGQLINAALAGNEGSFQRLYALHDHVGAASGLGFGTLLQAIALAVGDKTFANWVRDLSPREQQIMHHFLLAGFDYGKRPYRIEDFPKVLPLTYQLTHPAYQAARSH